jgi:hypothetical protein
MACICNGICDSNNCPTNVACYGNQPACPGNLYDFTANPVDSVVIGVLIEAQHIADLEVSINNERVHATRRGPVVVICPPDTASQACAANCSDSYTFTGSRGVGDDIIAGHFDGARDANDLTSFATIFPDGTFNIGDIVTAVKVLSLQTTINQTRDNCICDSHVSCNPDCCNLNCPGDDPGYLPN